MKNVYHRYLNLPFELLKPKIVDETPTAPTYIDNNPYNHKDMYFIRWLKNKGLVIAETETLYSPPNGYVPLHKDWHNQGRELAKINLTYGSEDSRLRWYNPKKVYIMTREVTDDLGDKRDLSLTDIENSNLYRGLSILDGEVDIGHTLTDEFYVETAKLSESEMIWEANTNRPSLVNAGIMHGTYNPSNTGRWTLSYVLRRINGEQLDFYEALEIFKDEIIGE